MDYIFFDSWESILRTLIITVVSYVVLIFFLRASGKRTLSKMNAFDFVVTIALGSTLATVILNKGVALADGIFGLFLLIFLQFIITSLSARFKIISNIVKSTPSLLVYKGEMLKDMMLKERVDEDEIHAIIREKGYSSVKEADAIVLETDGSLSVIKSIDHDENSFLQKIKTPEDLII
ncbi:MAG: DUF421 domain-containing protein [Chitinophagaceae bacterium]